MSSLPALHRADFPADFTWGCATSSYQIEGAVSADGRVPSIWDVFTARAGSVRDGSSGAVACDHYHRWPQDFDLARELGVNAYRFSIAWPRVFAAPGQINPAGLDFYERLVDGLLARGITPWPTLYHWDLPQYLQEQGGWGARSTAAAFAEFADAVSRRLVDRVDNWITHNEPWCTVIHGHYEGIHAPGLRDFGLAMQAAHHVLLSHGLALQALRANRADLRVGAALSLHPLRPASDSAADLAATKRHDGLRNRWFLDPLYGRGYPQDIWERIGSAAPRVEAGDMELIAGRTDFLGVNYYFPEAVADAPGQGMLDVRIVEQAGVERTAFGWEVSPQGLVDLLQRLRADYPTGPIYITENGASYEDQRGADGQVDDAPRLAYLARHLQALQQARAGGCDVRGFFAWSLLDNFEWAQGYVRRFGLTYVDFQTQERVLKASGHWYARFLHSS